MVWYYVKDGARQGPVDEAEFNSLVGQSVVRPDTLVWSEGMSDWRPYSTVVPAAPPPPAPEPRVEPRPEPRPEPVTQAVVAEAPVQAYAMESAVAPASVVSAQRLYCSQCGQQFASEELVRFGTAMVCANCKDIYAQRLRETGQVAGSRVYGGFWIRFGAVLIDGIALWIVNFAIQTVTGSRITNPNDLANLSRVMGTLGLNFLLSTGISLFYEAFFLVQYGATPGKMVCRLKVITPDGGGITWGRAIGRYFAKILSTITLCIGYIMAGFDAEKRALHDYVAGTRVIRVL
jgi:uncharacterized RDD family membrane protein YckC